MITTIILHASIADGVGEITTALEELCAQRNIVLQTQQVSPDSLVMIGVKAPTGTMAQEVPQEVEMTVAVPAELEAPAAEVEVATATLPAVEPAAQPEPQAPLASTSARILSLSMADTISAYSDSQCAVSTLYVSNIQCVGDYAVFDYCNCSFRIPLLQHALALDSSQYINNPDCISSYTSDLLPIRVVVDLPALGTIVPLIVSVRQSEDGQSKLVFGCDVNLSL